MLMVTFYTEYPISEYEEAYEWFKQVGLIHIDENVSFKGWQGKEHHQAIG
jgi:hypothetical protein